MLQVLRMSLTGSSDRRIILHWNYRVVRHTDVVPNGASSTYLGIHEVYSDKDDDDKVGGPTVDPVPLIGDDLEGLKWTLTKMMEALEKPILEEESMVGADM